MCCPPVKPKRYIISEKEIYNEEIDSCKHLTGNLSDIIDNIPGLNIGDINLRISHYDEDEYTSSPYTQVCIYIESQKPNIFFEKQVEEYERTLKSYKMNVDLLQKYNLDLSAWKKQDEIETLERKLAKLKGKT